MNLSDFAQRCGYWPQKEEIVRARLQALDLLVTCRRCKGTGKYEQNPLDQRCYGCDGRGKKLPPLTARLAATIRERVARGDLVVHMESVRAMREQCDAAIDRLKKTPTDHVYKDSDRDAAIRMFQWLKTASPSQIAELSVRAGIHNPDGSLTKEYGGKS